MESSQPILVAACGAPAMGKSTIARRVAERLNCRWVDHEVHVRVPFFGLGHPDPDASLQVREQFNIMQGTSYDILFAVGDAYLELGRSLVVSATFVSARSQRSLSEVISRHPNASSRLIWCHSENDHDEAVLTRLAGRKFGEDYFGGVNDLKSYREQKARWIKPPLLPHLTLDTFQHTVEECVTKALSYIQSKGGI